MTEGKSIQNVLQIHQLKKTVVSCEYTFNKR